MELNKKAEPMPDRKTQLEEECNDSIWRLIMYDYAEYKGEEYLKLNEEAKKDPRYQMSEKANKRIFKTLNNHFRKEKLLSIANKSKKILSRVAIIFFVFAAVFAVTFTTVEAFRVQVLNFILTREKEYTSVQITESDAKKDIIAGLSDMYAPSYIPEGYWINNIVEMPSNKMIDYVNDEGTVLRFIESNSTYTTNIDTENAETVKSIKINGADGLFVLKNEKTTVSWTMDNKVFVISAQISEEEIVQIAESVIFIK